jgi:hypothetical protein
MPDENDIQNLLKLKRYEQPSPEYFENFLREFQHRQRADLIREPLWKIAYHRVQAFFSEPVMGQFAYAGATAAVLLVAGVASLQILNNGNGDSTSAIAKTSTSSRQIAQNQISMGLDPRIRLADWNSPSSQSTFPGLRTTAANPHYVIDARPVSYEPPSSF